MIRSVKKYAQVIAFFCGSMSFAQEENLTEVHKKYELEEMNYISNYDRALSNSKLKKYQEFFSALDDIVKTPSEKRISLDDPKTIMSIGMNLDAEITDKNIFDAYADQCRKKCDGHENCLQAINAIKKHALQYDTEYQQLCSNAQRNKTFLYYEWSKCILNTPDLTVGFHKCWQERLKKLRENLK